MSRKTTVVAVALLLALALAGCGSDRDALTIYSGRTQNLIGPAAGEVQQGDRHRHRRQVRRLGRAGPAAGRGGRADPGRRVPVPEPGGDRLPGRQGPPRPARRRPCSTRSTRASATATAAGSASRAASGSWSTTPSRSPRPTCPDSVLDLTGDRFAGKVAVAPANGSFQDFVTAMRQLEGEETTETWLKAMAANEPPDLRQQQRHRRGGQPRRGRDGPGQPLLQLPLPAGEPRHPEPQPHLRRRRRRRPGDPVDGQRAGRHRQDRGGHPLPRLPAHRAESQRYFSDQTFEYPLVAGVPGRLRAAAAGQPALPRLRRRRRSAAAWSARWS